MAIENSIKTLLEGTLSQRAKDREAHDEKNKARAKQHYEMHHKDIHKLLDSIKSGLEKHKPDDKDIHWGHVGSHADLHSQLRHLNDRIHKTGEYDPYPVRVN